MSLIGYRNLSWLKARLLPAGMKSSSEYDTDISDIGMGVAALFDSYTGRVLRRGVGVIHETRADQSVVVATCYPIETVTATLLTGGGELDWTDNIETVSKRAGIIHFLTTPGASHEFLRLSITGGFYCEDDDEMPEGATPLPADLLAAWVRQCREACDAENIFRAKAAEKPGKATAALDTGVAGLMPLVKQTLNLYMRIP